MAKTAEKQAADPAQGTLPGADETIKAEIAKLLRDGKAFETQRIQAGKLEKENKNAAQALMEKYGFTEFEYGEGAEKVTGFFEQKKKLKIREGETAEVPEDGDGDE